jgi:hypothetical protein
VEGSAVFVTSTDESVDQDEQVGQDEQPAAVDDVSAPIRLRPWAKVTLVAFLLAVTGLFFAGTTVGNDNWWPFGPWRMYSTSTPPSGSVVALKIEVLEGTDPTWQPANLTPRSVGLNRAEIEGRVPQLTANPSILATLIRSHARLRPHDQPWHAIRVVRSEVLLSNGALTGKTRDTTLVTWPLSAAGTAASTTVSTTGQG